MTHPAFIIKRSKDGQYYFVLTAKNGQVLVTSECYTRKHNARKAIKRISEIAAEAEVRS